ncbi:hypothetical protein DSM104440_00125 [Usitatibacter palustris]|uniref:Uncharacterized protein n=1 Tax=Usitatibacter palustris TaxID=2732487 RepID=A0A6M4H1Y8_9PROT|nr:hypothetical protein DSM104440_00125 [Usitatibacter palustris]
MGQHAPPVLGARALYGGWLSMLIRLALALALTLLSSCAQLSKDESPDASRDGSPRGMIALGEIDLGRSQERHFEIPTLDAGARFVLGLHVTSGSCESLSSGRGLAVRVVDEIGRIVVDEDRPMRDFQWSRGRDECVPAFGYLRGQMRSVQIGSAGDVCNEPIYSGVDHGYGTYFVARNGARYTATVRLHGSASLAKDQHPEPQLALVALAFDGRHENRRCLKDP